MPTFLAPFVQSPADRPKRPNAERFLRPLRFSSIVQFFRRRTRSSIG